MPRDAAALVWMANLACLELHPHPVLAEELDHPNELRVDLDPVPGVEWRQVQDVARVVRVVLEELGLVGWPKTSGSRGIHVRIASSAPELRSGATRRPGAGPRGSNVARRALRPASGGRRSATASSSTTTKTPRIAPSRRPTGAAETRRAGLGAGPGTRSASATRVTSRCGRCRRGSRPAAIDTPRSTIGRARSTPSSSCRSATSAKSSARCRGHRTIASRLASVAGGPVAGTHAATRVPKARRLRVGGRPTGRRTTHQAVARDHGARAKEDALPVSSAGRRGSGGGVASRTADVLVDAMRGRFQTWTRIASTAARARSRRPAQEPLDPNEDPLTRTGVKASRSAGRRRRLRELERSRDSS